MSKPKSAPSASSDDFFGVEYVASTAVPDELIAKSRSEGPDLYESRLGQVKKNQKSTLPTGTEFLDQQFFDRDKLAQNEKQSDSTDRTDERTVEQRVAPETFLEKQFFRSSGSRHGNLLDDASREMERNAFPMGFQLEQQMKKSPIERRMALDKVRQLLKRPKTEAKLNQRDEGSYNLQPNASVSNKRQIASSVWPSEITDTKPKKNLPLKKPLKDQQQEKASPFKARLQTAGSDTSKTKPTEAKTALELFEELELQRGSQEIATGVATGGRKSILQLMTPIWKMDMFQMIDVMAQRVILNDESILAMDKPYGMAYSGGPNNQAQLDRILQHLKARLAPDIDRLHLVKALDKNCTGVIIFAKNKIIQSELKQLIADAKVEHRYRCLVMGKPAQEEALIKIPLDKTQVDGHVKMIPIVEGKPGKNPQFPETHYRLYKAHAYCSNLEATVFNEITNQIRAHLAYGIGCPIVGDPKYGHLDENRAPRPLPLLAQTALGLAKNQSRKLPMYCHLNQVSIPAFAHYERPILFRAPLPWFFEYTLKMLKLFKK